MKKYTLTENQLAHIAMGFGRQVHLGRISSKEAWSTQFKKWFKENKKLFIKKTDERETGKVRTR